MKNLSKLSLLVIAVVLALSLAEPTLAYGRDYGNQGYGPYYATGAYDYPHVYGFSGWGYNTVYYKYHQPYSTYRYGSHYGGYGYNTPWVNNYAYRVWPAYGQIW